jgi:beta-phosphoglucomutase
MAPSPEPTNRALALDLDGVLIDGMKYHVAAWQKAFGQRGIELAPQRFYEMEGISTREVIDRIADAAALDLSRKERDAIAADKRASYRQLFRVAPLEGARELVETAQGLGYGLALATGTTREAGERALAELGVRAAFEHVISGDDVPRGKPAPDIYLRAQELLGVDPRRCLVIENAPAGITAAIAAGLPCLAVATYLPPQALAEASVVLRDVRQATAWLRSEARSAERSGPFTLEKPLR